MRVAAGMAVMAAMFETEIATGAGRRASTTAAAVRHGTGKGSALGRRPVPLDRPQARAVDGHEAPLPTRARPG